MLSKTKQLVCKLEVFFAVGLQARRNLVCKIETVGLQARRTVGLQAKPSQAVLSF